MAVASGVQDGLARLVVQLEDLARAPGRLAVLVAAHPAEVELGAREVLTEAEVQRHHAVVHMVAELLVRVGSVLGEEPVLRRQVRAS